MVRSRWLILFTLLLASCGSDQPNSPMTPDVLKALDKARPIVFGPVECKFASAQICSENQCQEGAREISVSWNPDSGEYRRCDKNGCDSYQPKVSASDTYTVLSFPENGMMAKISERGDILEVASLMTTAFVKHGQCTATSNTSQLVPPKT